MQTVVSREGAVTIVKPLGPLVIGELDDIENALNELESNMARRIVINLSKATFIDSAGLEMLCEHQNNMNQYGVYLKLCSLTDISLKIMELTRLSSNFETYPDKSMAIRSYL